MDGVIDLYLESSVDYVSNVNPPSFPDGLDVEVFTFEALERAWQTVNDSFLREHVTLAMRRMESFKKVNLQHETDFSSFRWTVDTPEDLTVISNVYRCFLPRLIFRGQR